MDFQFHRQNQFSGVTYVPSSILDQNGSFYIRQDMTTNADLNSTGGRPGYRPGIYNDVQGNELKNSIFLQYLDAFHMFNGVMYETSGVVHVWTGVGYSILAATDYRWEIIHDVVAHTIRHICTTRSDGIKLYDQILSSVGWIWSCDISGAFGVKNTTLIGNHLFPSHIDEFHVNTGTVYEPVSFGIPGRVIGGNIVRANHIVGSNIIGGR